MTRMAVFSAVGFTLTTRTHAEEAPRRPKAFRVPSEVKAEYHYMKADNQAKDEDYAAIEPEYHYMLADNHIPHLSFMENKQSLHHTKIHPHHNHRQHTTHSHPREEVSFVQAEKHFVNEGKRLQDEHYHPLAGGDLTKLGAAFTAQKHAPVEVKPNIIYDAIIDDGDDRYYG